MKSHSDARGKSPLSSPSLSLSSSRFSSVREWQPATGRPATAAHPRHHHENRRRHCNRRRRQRRRQRRHRRLLRRSLSSRKPNAVRSVAGSAGRRLPEPSPQSSGIRRREGGTGGRTADRRDWPTSLNSWRRGRRGATSLGPTRDGGGRRAGGPGSGMRLLLLRNESRPSERGRGLTFCLACSPWPGPGRALLALLLGPGPLLGLGLPPVCVRTFVHRPHSTRERPEQSREEKTTFAACWLLLLLQPPACVSPCRPTVTLYTSFMEDMLIFFFV